jgi:hypothetical protein
MLYSLSGFSLILVSKRGEAMNEEHATQKLTANHVPSSPMYILICLFLTSFLITVPLLSFAAVFDVKDEDQMRTALNTASGNNEADVINIHSAMTLAESLKYNPENYPLTIYGNGFSISGNEKNRCLDIKDNKLLLRNAHISIHNLIFCNGSDLAAGGLLINYRSPNNSSNITITGCTFRENHHYRLYLQRKQGQIMGTGLGWGGLILYPIMVTLALGVVPLSTISQQGVQGVLKSKPVV